MAHPDRKFIRKPTKRQVEQLKFTRDYDDRPTLSSANANSDCFLKTSQKTFTSGAMELIVRSAVGVLRRCRNLCLATMLGAVRSSSGTTIDIDVINQVAVGPVPCLESGHR